MKLIIKVILASFILAVMPVGVGAAGGLFEGSDSAIKKLETASKGAGLGDPKTVKPADIVKRIVNAAVGFLGVIAVLLIVYAGGLWLTAAGNDQKVQKAKQIIVSTVIGMIIVGLAFAITTFIIGLVAGAPTAATGGDTKLVQTTGDKASGLTK